ncbi:ATP-grasp domain-containing protein [Pseudomonas tructae]|uniref:ATP-grasp domain-containing protein n=1 Tax=Pseudomonas tructae TaxID=2518644 RepID=A0A411MFU6_9PSED|nr:ATP-grasp domain-containing protein [Pseudomonas tructae]QBF25661.1 ATP-grasp domain-containing protein [Pseudomonas tructae]
MPEKNNGVPASHLTKKRLLLIGTSQVRPFILDESVKTAEALGLELILLDNVEARFISKNVIADSHFIGAPIDNHQPETTRAIVESVRQATQGKVDAVITFLNPYAELAGMMVDAFRACGNSGASVAAAHTKSTAREILSKFPDIATPYRVVKSMDEAVAAYHEMGGGKFVMKPIHGGGSALVVINIDSVQRVAEVYQEIDLGLREFASRPDAGVFLLDQHPGIMMERQLEGHEVDVELVLENGSVKFWHVSDNPPTDIPYPVEKGASYPSQLSPAWQEALVEAAGKAVQALGLTTANMHVEMMATADGPRVLEVNARMGGAFIWRLIKAVTGVNLVEQGIRSVLGLDVVGYTQPQRVGDVRYLVPGATGRIERLDGLDEAREAPGVDSVVRFKKAGEDVQLLPDDFFGWVAAVGDTHEQAQDAVLAAIDTIRIGIRQADGTLLEQTGAYAQEKVEVLNLLAPEVRDAPPSTKVMPRVQACEEFAQ